MRRFLEESPEIGFKPKSQNPKSPVGRSLLCPLGFIRGYRRDFLQTKPGLGHIWVYMVYSRQLGLRVIMQGTTIGVIAGILGV